MRKVSLFSIILIGAVVSVWYFFFFDNVVTEGEAYGFSIGMKKSDAVIALKDMHGEKYNRLILSPSISRNDVRDINFTSTTEFTANDVIDKEVWSIQFGGKETNALVLFFSNDKLVKMSRYRRAFIP